jgi:hypothetical protein
MLSGQTLFQCSIQAPDSGPLRYNSSKMGSQRRPLTAIKVGSTSLTVLAAPTLRDPWWEASYELGLLGADDPVGRLEAVLDTITERLRVWAPLPVVVGTGEVGRVVPPLGQALRRRGFVPWLMRGDEEARATWWAVCAEMGKAVTVIDVGGGSTEVVSERSAASFPAGAARPFREPPALGDFARDAVVAAGGSARLLGRWFDTQRLTTGALDTFAQELPEPETIAGRLGVSRLRAGLLAGGAACLRDTMKALEVDACRVASLDLRHGLWIAGALGRAARWAGDDVS